MSKVLKLYILSVVGVQCSKCIHESLIYIRQKSCTKFHVFCCLFFQEILEKSWQGSNWCILDRVGNIHRICDFGDCYGLDHMGQNQPKFYCQHRYQENLLFYQHQWVSTRVLLDPMDDPSPIQASFNFVNFDLPIGRNKQHGSLITHFKIVLDMKSLSKSLVEYFIFH